MHNICGTNIYKYLTAVGAKPPRSPLTAPNSCQSKSCLAELFFQSGIRETGKSMRGTGHMHLPLLAVGGAGGKSAWQCLRSRHHGDHAPWPAGAVPGAHHKKVVIQLVLEVQQNGMGTSISSKSLWSSHNQSTPTQTPFSRRGPPAAVSRTELCAVTAAPWPPQAPPRGRTAVLTSRLQFSASACP